MVKETESRVDIRSQQYKSIVTSTKRLLASENVAIDDVSGRINLGKVTLLGKEYSASVRPTTFSSLEDGDLESSEKGIVFTFSHGPLGNNEQINCYVGTQTDKTKILGYTEYNGKGLMIRNGGNMTELKSGYLKEQMIEQVDAAAEIKKIMSALKTRRPL